MNSQWKLPLAIAGGFSVLVMGVETFRHQGWEGHINCLDDRLRGKETVSVQEVRMAWSYRVEAGSLSGFGGVGASHG